MRDMRAIMLYLLKISQLATAQSIEDNNILGVKIGWDRSTAIEWPIYAD